MAINQRVNYFKGEFLRVIDFKAEQEYHRDSLCYHNRHMHTPGIASGLEVVQTGSRRVKVNPGVAVDGSGRQIVLLAPVDLELPDEVQSGMYLTIAHSEKTTDPVNETGLQGDTRITEVPALKWSKEKPADESGELILTQVITGADGTIQEIKTGSRRYVGVNAGELAVKTLTFPDLNEPVRLERNPDSGGLLVSAKFTGFTRGNVGIGTDQPQAKLTVKGNVSIGSGDPGEGNLQAVGKGSFGAGLSVQSPDGKDLFSVDPKGNTVAGDLTARGNLTVSGNLSLLTGEKHNPIYFTTRYMGRGADEQNKAEICNDTTDNKALVIEGNRSNDGKISRVLVKGRLDVAEQFWVNDSKKYDLAEMTPVCVEDKLEPGEAVVIDWKEGFRVKRSVAPWDTGVYGIVSSVEQAAMIIGAPQDGELPIALCGRVKARVSAEAGPVEPGDLLATSATPGYLMRCNDRAACAGAIAGKALEPLREGLGEILIRVGS